MLINKIFYCHSTLYQLTTHQSQLTFNKGLNMSKNISWGGRFEKGPNDIVAQYTESISFDKALYKHDILGSQAHAAMLGQQKIITDEETQILIDGLDTILKEIESGQFVWKPELEDVHMNIESRLIDIVGDTGKKLHTGRSRNDQVGLTFRLYICERICCWQSLIIELIQTLVKRADEHKHDILPGYTHLQAAQPISLAQHLLAYAFMLKRDFLRMQDAEKRAFISPLGAAALAGTTYNLDPQFVCKKLNMHGTFDNSMDAVSDRDYVLEALFTASCTMMHLSRFCEEIIIWANPAFGFVQLPDEYSTGSSIMPQKKNPDVAELMRGKIGRVYGALTSLLTIMKGLPLAYNRDLQEDKEPFFDTDRTLSSSLMLMSGMLENITFCTDRMEKACKSGYLNATEMADYLVSKNIAFRQAHHYTGIMVALAEKDKLGLEDLPLQSLQAICPEVEQDVYAVLDYATSVRRRETHGGTGPKSVEKQIHTLNTWLKS